MTYIPLVNRKKHLFCIFLPRRNSKNVGGYSLIELCLVICLSAIILFFTQHWILKSYQSMTQQQHSVAHSLSMHRCFQILTKDFRSNIYHKNSIKFPKTTDSFSTLTAENSLILTHRSLENPDEKGNPEKIVEYALLPDTPLKTYLLVRKELIKYNSTPAQVIHADVLLTNVSKLIFGIDFLLHPNQPNQKSQWIPINPLSEENLNAHSSPLHIKIWLHTRPLQDDKDDVQVFNVFIW